MWKITKDLLDEGSEDGTSSLDYQEGNDGLLKFQFRLLDGDGEICYEGCSDERDSNIAFAPLDDFGNGHAGCTEIQYLHGLDWKQL
jgi:hypothetical protein